MSVVLALVALPGLLVRGPITYSCRAKPAEAVIKDLSEATGESLRIAKSIAAEPLILNVKDVESQTLLDKIAAVLHAEWARDEQGLRLVRTPAVERSIQREAHQALVARLQRALDALKAKPTLKTAFTTQEANALAQLTEKILDPGAGPELRGQAEVEAAVARTPAARGAIRLLATLPAEAMAECIEQQGGVFATQPTSMQRQLPSASMPVLNQMLAEQTAYVEATDRYEQAHPRTSSDEVQVSYLMRPKWTTGNPKLGVGKVIARFAASGDFCWIELLVGDTEGKLLIRASASTVLPAEPIVPLPAGSEEPQFHPSAVSQEITSVMTQPVGFGGSMQMMANTANGMKKVVVPSASPTPPSPLTQATLETILHPENHNPLDVTVTDAILEYAGLHQLNVVASPDDRSWWTVQRRVALAGTAADLLDESAFRYYDKVELKDRWLTVTSAKPIEATEMRTNLPAFGVLVQTLKRQSYLTLDDISRFALSQQKPADNGSAEYTYLTLINAIAANRSYDPYHWLTYRIYGSLNEPQRQTLFSGGNLRLVNLTPGCQADLRQLIFHNVLSSELTRPDGTVVSTWEEPILLEWTQALPDGLRDIQITGKADREAAVFALNSSTGVSGFETVQTLAGFDYVRETPTMSGFVANLPTYDKYAPATVTEILLTFRTPPGIVFTQDLHDGGADLGTLSSQFPGDIRAKVDAELADLRKVFRPGGARQPPP